MSLVITYVNNRPYATIKDACAYLELSRSRLSQLVNSGELPSMRIGSSVLVEAEAIEAYANANRKPGRKKSNCRVCKRGIERAHDEYFACTAPGKGRVNWRNRDKVKNCKLFEGR